MRNARAKNSRVGWNLGEKREGGLLVGDGAGDRDEFALLDLSLERDSLPDRRVSTAAAAGAAAGGVRGGSGGGGRHGHRSAGPDGGGEELRGRDAAEEVVVVVVVAVDAHRLCHFSP